MDNIARGITAGILGTLVMNTLNHTHIFSPERLAALMENAGFAIEEAKLIGNRSKAVFAIGIKE